jgi:hypothetical protein
MVRKVSKQRDSLRLLGLAGGELILEIDNHHTFKAIIGLLTRMDEYRFE